MMKQIEKKRVIGIVGPTASGKTALSLRVARALRGEIICMDSMQIYRGMDIGTAKPTADEIAQIPHHLHSFLAPGDSFSVTQYAKAARALIQKINVPILVGGTGLYLQSLSLPMDYGAVSGNESIRAKYHQIAETQGNQHLHELLRACDPPSAARLHPNDIRRVIRALEVFELTGIPLSQQRMPSPEECPYDFQLYALDLPRSILYARIEKRVDEMLQAGLLDEVRALYESGVDETAQSMQGLGYKELLPVIRGEMPLKEGVSLLKMNTRHFAKRQITWFKRDERIHWLPWKMDMDLGQLAAMICQQYMEK